MDKNFCSKNARRAYRMFRVSEERFRMETGLEFDIFYYTPAHCLLAATHTLQRLS